jgi:chloramphenicol 3-O-phosphotransferase
VRPVDGIFINGTVGAGKTTVAAALSAIESTTHAVVDLDEIRRLSTSPASDRFNHELELRNLRGLAANYRRAGAQRFILAGVIEERAEIARYVDALGTNGIFFCRLVAGLDILSDRLARRHEGDPAGLTWHLGRVTELAQILDAAAFDDLVLDSSAAAPAELARTVRRAAGWV